MKFRVGDFVTRIGPVYDGDGLTPEEYGLGQDLEVTGAYSYYVLKDQNGNQYSAWEEHLEFSEIMKSPLMKALA